jgi:hypothetical protein
MYQKLLNLFNLTLNDDFDHELTNEVRLALNAVGSQLLSTSHVGAKSNILEVECFPEE